MVAKEGYPFIIIAVFLAILSISLLGPWGLSVLIVPAFVVYFFRDPPRQIPSDPQAILSPADGKIIAIEEVETSRYSKERSRRISIFMSPLNVHVNRIPCDGQVEKIFYNKGKYLSAFKEKASLDNEQNAVLLQTSHGTKIVFVQIAGFIARRIVCYLREGEAVKKGERFGLIRFGSRMDIYLPPDYPVAVRLGQTAVAGETILARFL